MVSKNLLSADELMHSVASDIDTTLINPTNAESVKEVFTGKEPQFVYHKAPQFLTVKEQLEKLRFPKSPEGQILSDKRDYLSYKIQLIKNIGTKRFTRFSKKIHPLPTKKLVSQALEVLEQPTTKKDSKVALHDATQELEACIKQLGIPWQVQKASMIASACVVPSKRLLYLKDKKQFSKRFIDRLKIHEIGTHAARAENGRLQPLKVFLHGFARYLPTEEGLAAFNEDKFGLLDKKVLRTYAGRVMAVHLAQKMGYVELVNELKTWFGENKAMVLALRAKRGVEHGSDKGGYTKDSAYLKGYLELKDYDSKGGDFTPLYYGKVSLESLPLLEKIDWLKKPKYLPEMIKL